MGAPYFNYGVPFKGRVIYDPEWVAGGRSGGLEYKTLLGWAAHLARLRERYEALRCLMCGEHPVKNGKGPVYGSGVGSPLCPDCAETVRKGKTTAPVTLAQRFNRSRGNPQPLG
jgi:hypothetical protein